MLKQPGNNHPSFGLSNSRIPPQLFSNWNVGLTEYPPTNFFLSGNAPTPDASPVALRHQISKQAGKIAGNLKGAFKVCPRKCCIMSGNNSDASIKLD